MQPDIQKILVVKPCALGDMILALPTIRALKKQYGGEVHLLTNPLGAIAAEGNPYIDKVIVLTEDDGADAMGKVRGLFNWKKLYSKLHKEQYDLAVSLRYTARNNAIVWISGAKTRVGYSIDGTQVLLTNSCSNRTKEKILPDEEYGVHLLGLIGIKSVSLKLEFSVSAEASAFVAPYIALAGSERKIALNLYSNKGYHRSLREENLLKIAREVAKLGKIYFVGSQEEAGYLEGFVERHHLPAIVMAGKCSFMQSAALLKQMDSFITTDGGALHLGKALGIRVMALLGDSSPIQWGTHELQNETVFVQRSCAPCRITKAACSYRNDCLDSLVDYAFLQRVRSFIDRTEAYV